MRTQKETYTPEQPFGNPDGSRAPIEDVLDGFVAFGGGATWGGLAMKDDDLTIRVIVGRKGSGKTVYLRRLRAHVTKSGSLITTGQDNDSRFTDEIQQSLPSTNSIVRFCQWFDRDTLTEKWMQLWRSAILRSIVSNLLFHPRLSSYLSSDQKTHLTSIYPANTRSWIVPTSIYSEVSYLINNSRTRHEMSSILEHESWFDIEYLIGDYISTCPPLTFYIDAVDEEFAHAPMEWHRCQKGLFYQVMRFVRDSRLGSRLHIIISIRDIVLSSIYRSEHATRYRDEPHIRLS